MNGGERVVFSTSSAQRDPGKICLCEDGSIFLFSKRPHIMPALALIMCKTLFTFPRSFWAALESRVFCLHYFPIFLLKFLPMICWCIHFFHFSDLCFHFISCVPVNPIQLPPSSAEGRQNLKFLFPVISLDLFLHWYSLSSLSLGIQQPHVLPLLHF